MASKSTRKGKRTKKTKGFFQSPFVRFIIVLLIAAAIPITVMGVQRVQNLEQEAASTPKAGKDCSLKAGSPIIAEPLAPTFGETITFKRATGSFTKDDFEFRIPLGSGVDSNKCTFVNGEIQNCPTKKGTTKDIKVEGEAKRGTVHTITENGTPVCEYYVVFKESKPVPTKDTTKPTKDPNKPTATPNPNKKCQANLSSGSCTADNKPRLRASWNMSDDGPCSVRVGGVEISTECTNSNKDITELNGKALENGKTYEIVISNSGSCNGAKPASNAAGAASAKAPTCTGGTSTNPSSGTTTAGKFGTPEVVKASCDTSGTQKNPKLKVYGYTTPLAASYIVRLRTNEGGSVVKEEKTDKTELILPIELDETYYYSVIAIDNDGKKAAETKLTNDRRITCKASNFPLAGAPNAIDIISEIWEEITH